MSVINRSLYKKFHIHSLCSHSVVRGRVDGEAEQETQAKVKQDSKQLVYFINSFFFKYAFFCLNFGRHSSPDGIFCVFHEFLQFAVKPVEIW